CMSGRGNGYRLEFSGLKEGRHSFRYAIDEEFMALFPEADTFFSPDIKVTLEVEKLERMMSLHFRFEGGAATRCDRCLRDVRFEVESEDEIIVKTAGDAETGAEDEENLWWVSEKDTELDLAPYFYETIVLSRPLQVFCPEAADGTPGCDPAMLALYRSAETAPKASTEPDPRWEALRTLRDAVSENKD
ncbi:MAG: DUF177 domain-containing protein, partial [Bacteroidales bacterium]|nr:DUF177 domain-containing protein [Bacteroidales bacterium]